MFGQPVENFVAEHPVSTVEDQCVASVSWLIGVANSQIETSQDSGLNYNPFPRCRHNQLLASNTNKLVLLVELQSSG